MDTEKSPEVWHRLSNESGRVYEAFKVYMFMSPAERSVVRAWREWTGNPEAVRPSPFFEDDSFVEQLRPADVVQILRVHLETIQKLGDTSSQAPDSGVDWSEDEQRELDRILDEIESEQAQEEPSSGSEDGD